MARLSSGGLAVSGLTVRFGGLVAVDDASFEAPRGQVTGLVGPNGAGKSTTFNACSGLNRPSAGKVFLEGQDVTSSSPAARARRGLGRTFQKMELFDSLSVRENVRMGYEAGRAGARPLRLLRASRREKAEADARAVSAIDQCGLGALAARRPSELSTGQRRLVELARVMTGDFTMLLLDEPSSGLDKKETARFSDILEGLIDERGLGILLVEHDMSLVLGVCSSIYVLDFGKMIFRGTPSELTSSAVVRAAYLGSEAADEDVA